MTEEYNGWKIYYGAYGTREEIAKGVNSFWSDIDLMTGNLSLGLGCEFETRDAALIAARDRINELNRLEHPSWREV